MPKRCFVRMHTLTKSLRAFRSADMEFFISQVEVILPVVGFDFLRPKGRVAVTVLTKDTVARAQTVRLELSLSSERLGYTATAIELDGEFTVLKGSTATTKSDFVSNTYATLRD